jgi:hypothetical protein
MKNIFLKPIGTLRELGTPRQWITEAIGLLLCAALFILAYILI